MNDWPAYMSVHQLCAWSLWRSELGIKSPRTLVIGVVIHWVGAEN